MKKKTNKLQIGKLFSQSLEIYKKNWFNFILIGLIFMFISGIQNFSGLSFDQVTGELFFSPSGIIGIITWVASVYLGIGFIRYMLKLVNGEVAKLKDIFYGVDSVEHFAFVVLVGIVSGLILILAAIPFGISFGMFVMSFWISGPHFLLLFLGLLLIVPFVFVALGLMFSKYIMIENKGGNVEVMDAIKDSWKMTKGYKWKLLWLGIVVFFFNILGFLALGIGLIITLPVSSIIMTAAYKSLSLSTE